MSSTPDELQRRWRDKGFVVLCGAAPTAAIERYLAERDAARDRLLVCRPGDEHASLAAHAEPGGEAGALDPHAVSGAARDLLVAPAVVAWLRGVYDEAPLLFDAAEAAAGGPDEAPYRDPTYFGVTTPATLVGAVVALGDAAVSCFAGSHRLPAAPPFSDRHRHFNLERDGAAALVAHREHLAAALAEAATGPTVVELAACDVVLWQAELVHDAPRGAAFVAHFCPASAAPLWFAYRPDRAARAPHGDAWLASRRYDLDGATPHAPEPPPAAPAPQTAPAAPPPATPQRGGLVGTVRGLMGRRAR